MYLSDLIDKLLVLSAGSKKDVPVSFFTETNGRTNDVIVSPRFGVKSENIELVEIQIEPLYKG